MTVALHQAGAKAAARRNLSLDEYMEDALQQPSNSLTPTKEPPAMLMKNGRSKTGIETQGQGRR